MESRRSLWCSWVGWYYGQSLRRPIDRLALGTSTIIAVAWTLVLVSIDGKCISLPIKVASRVIGQLDAFDRLL